jgi:hypothetical protein
MLRVLIGEADYVETMRTAAENEKGIPWIMPKDSSTGDEAALFFPSEGGFLALGAVRGPTRKTTFGRRNVYTGVVHNIQMLPMPITLDAVQQAIPEWTWTTYPRSYTTPSSDVVEQLDALLRGKTTRR